MSLENNISEVIQKQLKGDLIEKVIAEQLETCVRKAVDDLFGHWGDAKKIVEEKIKEVMIPQLERYDYSKHIVKLDTVLTQILKATTIDNKKILENFEDYFLEDLSKEITVSQMFDKYVSCVEKNVETDGLEVDYDDEPSYESVTVTVEVEEEEGRSWSKYKHATIYFECEHDKNLNFEIKVMQSPGDDYYFIVDHMEDEFRSLKNSNSFELFLLRMREEYTQIKFDITSDEEDVTPEKTLECTFS